MFFDDEDEEGTECAECGEKLNDDDEIFYDEDDAPMCQDCWEDVIGYD